MPNDCDCADCRAANPGNFLPSLPRMHGDCAGCGGESDGWPTSIVGVTLCTDCHMEQAQAGYDTVEAATSQECGCGRCHECIGDPELGTWKDGYTCDDCGAAAPCLMMGHLVVTLALCARCHK